LPDITSNADIVVCATGKAKFFDRSYFKQGAIIIDVGISRQEGASRISGDVDFQDLQGHASYITPVPGGIGPLTVAYLLSNTFKAAFKTYAKQQ
jgi:methylenetetrahydrofolate dehydrogenase (NADP+)/methenyltetrahydrofolate cyclohydrolase